MSRDLTKNKRHQHEFQHLLSNKEMTNFVLEAAASPALFKHKWSQVWERKCNISILIAFYVMNFSWIYKLVRKNVSQYVYVQKVILIFYFDSNYIPNTCQRCLPWKENDLSGRCRKGWQQLLVQKFLKHIDWLS